MKLDVAAAVAILTTILSVVVKVVGVPDQIKSNHIRKSVEGLSVWFIFLSFFSYLMWMVHGLFIHDWSLIVGQGLGVITTGIIVGQFFKYRRTTPPKPGKISRPLSTGLALTELPHKH